ncbi:hypothetical protein E2A64_12720 [Pseudohoeflea suaedae]|uniref:Uncharacterized protein n=1 Tax=Pseudohoeflea suaedae TaxID=877384 RepID=A0A4R5PLD7_9HYPH|nr:hypothetical protein [Pseudohoeflea suaedae]TDH36148.1 hypothetical protein E2A64_12720 [Pseudohoeflea suaedae]
MNLHETIARFSLKSICAVVFAFLLASCSTTTEPRSVANPFRVTIISVVVSSDFGVDPVFVARLAPALRNSVGGSAGNMTRFAELRIFVRWIRQGISTLGATTVAYDIVLTATDNGRMLYSEPVRLKVENTEDLIPAMIEDVRRLTGIADQPPVPVSVPVRPAIRPARQDFIVNPTPPPVSLARREMAREARDGDIISGNEPCVVSVANDCTVFDAAE